MRGEYFYHGTSTLALEGIHTDGLVSEFGPRRLPSRNAVYLSKYLWDARRFANARRHYDTRVVRDRARPVKFSWRKHGEAMLLRVAARNLEPDLLKKDWLGAVVYHSAFEFFSWMYYGTIPPEHIEVYVLGKWKPILDVTL